MKEKLIPFIRAKLGDRFQYSGDLFVKTEARTAWEIRNGRRYKEWAFQGDELVRIIPL
jgi:hypothetical protein